MNRHLSMKSILNISMIVVAAMATASGISPAQEFSPGTTASSGCATGSCGVAIKPRLSNCPNGQCRAGKWTPTQPGGRAVGQASRPAYTSVTPAPGVSQSLSWTNRESPFYTESDRNPQTLSERLVAPASAVRTKNVESPFYE